MGFHLLTYSMVELLIDLTIHVNILDLESSVQFILYSYVKSSAAEKNSTS